MLWSKELTPPVLETEEEPLRRCAEGVALRMPPVWDVEKCWEQWQWLHTTVNILFGKGLLRELPGGPVVKTRDFQCCGPRVRSPVEELRLQKPQSAAL